MNYFEIFCFEFTEMLHAKEDPALYGYINQGCLTVDNMDDKEEMRLVDVSNFYNSLLCDIHIYKDI